MSTKKKSATKKSTVRVIGRRAAGKTHRATPAVPQADGAAADRAHADAERGKPANNFGFVAPSATLPDSARGR